MGGSVQLVPLGIIGVPATMTERTASITTVHVHVHTYMYNVAGRV